MADPIMSRLATGPLGLGCAPIGNLYRAMSDDAAHHLLEEAWNAGVRWFDTAPHYGLGLSERRLGDFLKTKPRDSFIVSTKVGRRLVPNSGGSLARDDQGFDVPAAYTRVWDFTEAGVTNTLEASLDRLQLDHVDLVLLHDPSEHLDTAIGEAGKALVRMREHGLVAAVGAGTRDLDALARVVRELPVDAVMTAGRYTLLDHDAEETLLPLCLDAGVAVLNVGVFNSGILASATPPSTSTYEYSAAAPEVLHRARLLAELCRTHETILPAAALAFARAHPAIANIAVGASDPSELREDLELVGDPPSDELWLDAVAAGLLSSTSVSAVLQWTPR